MAIKLYGPLMSIHVVRVEMTLLEKGVTDFEKVQLNMMRGAHKKPDYLALNPFGEVPVLIDGDLTLFESRAICRYIAHKFEGQGTPLCGSNLQEMALVEQWMEVESQNLILPITGLSVERISKRLRFDPRLGTQPDEAKVAMCIEQLGKILDVYETHLKGSKYLAGDFFSLADLAHLPTLGWLYHENLRAEGEYLIDSRPHLKAWWEDISSRPTWRDLSARIGEELKAFKALHKVT